MCLTAYADTSLRTVRRQEYVQLALAGAICHQSFVQLSLALCVLQAGFVILSASPCRLSTDDQALRFGNLPLVSCRADSICHLSLSSAADRFSASDLVWLFTGSCGSSKSRMAAICHEPL